MEFFKILASDLEYRFRDDLNKISSVPHAIDPVPHNDNNIQTESNWLKPTLWVLGTSKWIFPLKYLHKYFLKITNTFSVHCTGEKVKRSI